MRQFARTLAVACLAVGIVFTVHSATFASDGPTFESHVTAGEFAPAMAMARSAAPDTRDAMLNRIAQAQVDAGMRRQALTTTSEMKNDFARAHSFSELLAMPVGCCNNNRIREGGINNSGAQGGNNVDFGELIGLITETTERGDTPRWFDSGGAGTIRQFQGGVRVDAEGLVESLINKEQNDSLDVLRSTSVDGGLVGDVREEALLRKVSLPRLERAIQLKLALGEPIDEEMEFLAGIRKIEYVFVYPETGDVVIAGPAGDWRTDGEGRVVSNNDGRPVLRLEDLLVVLREMRDGDKNFGCSIEPLQENLARTKEYLDRMAQRPLRPGQRNSWLKGIRDNLAEQEIKFYGVDPRTRVARVLFEADYRMKLTGIGVEQGAAGVPSYLSMVKLQPGEPAPPMGVMRWWFTMNYDSILANDNSNAFQLRGQGVKVKSENEMLADDGQRIHTGQSDVLTAEFAKNFTDHFAGMAAKYPVYAELQNVFDLALVSALIQAQDLPGQAGWQMTTFANESDYPVGLGFEPKMVETVMNHRVLNRTQILAVASGGVSFSPSKLVQPSAIETDDAGTLSSIQDRTEPVSLERGQWWWD